MTTAGIAFGHILNQTLKVYLFSIRILENFNKNKLKVIFYLLILRNLSN